MNRPTESVHSIRLRHPWNCEAAGPNQICCTRRFGCPTNIGRDDQVDLVIESITGLVTVDLNETELRVADSGACFRRDVTNLLKPRNEVQLLVSRRDAAEPEQLDSGVRLEIYTKLT